MASTLKQERQGRDVTINLRANRRQRALIDRAAEALGKSRSDFMLDAACREAGAVLADRRFFLLDEKVHRRFTAALHRPPTPNPPPRRPLAASAPGERRKTGARRLAPPRPRPRRLVWPPSNPA